MAEVPSIPSRAKPSSAPTQITLPASFVLQPSRSAVPLQTAGGYRSGHLNLDTFSPVNQNGSFEFDKVLKTGKVHRRVRNRGAWKTSWKPVHLVLRPNLLSIYKSEEEAELLAALTLSDVTAVALVKKSNREYVFGVFSASKNYHFQGLSEKDAQDWVERIRSEAHVEGEDEELFLASPRLQEGREDIQTAESTSDQSSHEAHDRSSSPELQHWSPRSRKAATASTSQRIPSQLQEYSGNEIMTSYSDLSDVPIPNGKHRTSISSSKPENNPSKGKASATITTGFRPGMARNASQMSGFDMTNDPERVVWHGHLQCLKTKGGVKQWKRLWVVLRPKNLSLYKNEQEYAAVMIIPMSQIINAAEIDPISKSKPFCLQIIAEDKNYRFCAPDEEALAKWLGALKSVLAKRRSAVRRASEAKAYSLPMR